MRSWKNCRAVFIIIIPMLFGFASFSQGSSNSGNVLWDLTHGLYAPGYTPSGDYSTFTTILSSAGLAVTTTTDIANADLSSYQFLVVCLGSAWHSAYTTAEQSKIQTFVQNGGALLIMGDNQHTPNANINNIAQSFGITLGGTAYLGNSIGNFSGHSIFAGISQLYFLWFGELNVSTPARLIAWDAENKGCVAIARIGSGRVVAVGDIDFCRNLYISNADNQKFIANIFDWLSNAGSNWPGDKFDFDDGTTQGWIKEGAFDESGNGPFFNNFTFEWYDYVNYPNAPAKDPSGDAKGSLSLYTWGNHGVPNPSATWWIMRYKSPDLSGYDSWQTARGYTAEIAECMSPASSLYANLYVIVYDQDQARDRYFYNGDAVVLTHDFVNDNIASWNHLTFDWSGISTFPTNYTIKNIYVNLWGKMDVYVYQGGTYLDEVVPIKSLPIPDVQDDSKTEPAGYVLYNNFPNPFNPETTIEFQIPQHMKIILAIYDLQGHEIRTLLDDTRSAGHHSVIWDGRDDEGNFVASGMYLYKLRTDRFSMTKKCLLIK